MTRQDVRLRNRRVKKQALLVQKKLLASVNNRILKPLLREVRRETNLDQNGLLGILNLVFINADLDNKVTKDRFSRNRRDIKNYAKNYLNEINKVYEKEKERQANKTKV